MKSMKISFILLLFSFLFSCKKKETLPVVPTVVTAAITDPTASTAKGGGQITSDGGSLVTASGLCYSTTSQVPTVADDTTRTAALTGNFTSTLKNLSSNATYYVRAYATNKVGTGYGEVKSFVTGNEAPLASNVTITGEIKADVEVTATYSYTDKEGDLEDGTTIQWYRADNAAGQNTVAIPDATTNKYRISDADEDKVLWVGITPKAATGTQAGVEATSAKTSAVGAATTVTFTYNGGEVTYGIINSSVTGRSWLDRNLGAPNAPTAFNDYVNLGDLFQWGRPADGHQLITRTPDPGDPFHGGSSPVNATTTTTLSTTDVPGNNVFILSSPPFDWRSSSNNNLWQGVNGTNNPCPGGWRLPTITEWMAEQLGDNIETNFGKLNFTHSGQRYSDDGSFTATNGAGFYWTSTTNGASVKLFFQSDGNTPISSDENRGSACAVRCIKN